MDVHCLQSTITSSALTISSCSNILWRLWFNSISECLTAAMAVRRRRMATMKQHDSGDSDGDDGVAAAVAPSSTAQPDNASSSPGSTSSLPSISSDSEEEDNVCGSGGSGPILGDTNTIKKDEPPQTQQDQLRQKKRKQKTHDDDANADVDDVAKGWDQSLSNESVMRMSRLALREASCHWYSIFFWLNLSWSSWRSSTQTLLSMSMSIRIYVHWWGWRIVADWSRYIAIIVWLALIQCRSIVRRCCIESILQRVEPPKHLHLWGICGNWECKCICGPAVLVFVPGSKYLSPDHIDYVLIYFNIMYSESESVCHTVSIISIEVDDSCFIQSFQ